MYNKNENVIRVGFIRNFGFRFGGSFLSKPEYRENWTVEELLTIEDRQKIVTLLSTSKEKQKDQKDKDSIDKFKDL